MSTRITRGSCIAEMFTPRLRELENEQCWMLTLTQDHRVINEHLVAEGVAAEVLIKTRAVLRLALIDEAAAFALVHNHPSNNLDPSPQDLETTERLHRGAQIVGIRMLDHVICTPLGPHFSFYRAGLLTKESDEPAEPVLRPVPGP